MIARLSRFALLCLCALALWLPLRRPWKRRLPREIALGLFVAWLCALLVMVLEGVWASPAAMLQSARERIATGSGILLTPFGTIGQQLAAIRTDEALTQLLGNTVLFMPWGFFLALLWRRFRHILPMAGMCLLLTCSIEFIQLFIGRTVDVDDLILNFLGGMAGGGLWWIVHWLLPASDCLLPTQGE